MRQGLRVLAAAASRLRIAVAVIVASIWVAADAWAAVSVIPAPAAMEVRGGAFTIQAGMPVGSGGNAEAERIARYFTDLVERTTGMPLKVAEAGRGISFELQPDVKGVERYMLDVSAEGVVVKAGTPQGLFYGAITLWQLLTSERISATAVRVPLMSITDSPRFAWRGVMLDVSRHFMPPELVKQMIDWMALHKLNTLHWHLTDDQGWRLEIKKYPRLTSVGAWRAPAGAGKSQRYGGFYTQNEVREIVQYAAERFITIVPEIEMPGHAQATIAAYPELGTGEQPGVSSDWGVHTYIFNVDESTFGFLEDVLAEVMQLFPGKYIHVAGDEPVKDRWRASPRVQQRMRELGLPNEAALQNYFVRRMEKFLSAQGRKLIGWDEILEGGLPPAATVMSWRGTQGAIEAVHSGHDVVMAPSPDLYLDYLQSDSPDEPPGRPRVMTLEHVYGFEPVPRELSGEQAHHVLGAQVNLWTEHMRTPERVQHNAFPRVAALAEMTWSSAEKREWKSFVERLGPQFERYRRLGIAFADSAFEPRISVRSDRKLELAKQVEAGEIRYTLNGSEPGAKSKVYRAPVEVKLPAEVRAVTVLNGRRMSETRARKIDPAALLRRTDDELKSCQQSLVLRLEDDAPLDGERAIFNVDILDPCWIYKDADLSRISGIAASVGQIPFNFQVGDEVRKIPLQQPQTPEGELEVRIDSCEGERIAVLPLAPAIGRDALTTLPQASITAHEGRHDLCLRFTRRSIDPIWAIDWVQLVE